MGSFADEIASFEAKTLAKMDLAARKISLEILSSLVLKSPVDTGRFRGNWQVGIGSIPSGTVGYSGTETISERAGVEGPVYASTIVKAEGAAFSVNAGDVVYLANNLPYAMALEEGHSSTQAPHGMVALTVQEFDSIVKAIGVELGQI